MIRGLHHVGIHVQDIDRMVKFYREAFGFEVVGEEFSFRNEPLVDKIIDVPGAAARGCMMRAGTCYVELFQYSAPEPSHTKPLRPFDRGYTHLCIDVTDIEKEYDRLRGVGMTFGDRDPVDVGHVKTLYGYDPEGRLVEIQQTAPHCEFPLSALPPIPA
jgi:catechol 2,3-dioxygenase-like lactoylglutathione lyase family enzyme